MKKYLFANPLLFCATAVLAVLTQVSATATSFLLMFIIDAIHLGEISRLVTAAYVAGGFVVLFYAGLWAFTKMLVFYSVKAQLRLKNDIFGAVTNLGISDFGQSNSARYISLINNDIKEVADKYFSGILSMTKDVAAIAFALGAMAFISPVNAAIALLLSVTPLVLPMIFGKKLSRTSMAHMQKLGRLNEKVKDFLTGFEVLKTFKAEGIARRLFGAAAAETAKAQYAQERASMKLGAISGTMLVATQFITFLVAGYFVIAQQITIGAVIAISGLSGSIAYPIQLIAVNWAQIKSTKGIRRGLMEIVTPKKTRERSADADFSDGIVLEGISFEYSKPQTQQTEERPKKPKVKMIPLKSGQSVEDVLAQLGIDPKEATVLDGHGMSADLLEGITSGPLLPAAGLANPVLRDVSYNFRPGGKYAVVGESGSGKSTLLRLIMGYYDDYAGSLRVGASEIRDISRESLYAHMSILQQSVFVLDDTLRNNITLHNPYTDSEFAEAVARAHLDGVMHKLGPQTALGEGGSSISGGERQRVALARAFITGCNVIILDEAMSGLDNETAHGIEKTLLSAPGLTCIFATHRYSRDILQMCDGILVLRGGRLVESGTFDELFAQKGYFYSLYSITSA